MYEDVQVGGFRTRDYFVDLKFLDCILDHLKGFHEARQGERYSNRDHSLDRELGSDEA